MKMKFATIILFLTAFAAFFLALPLQGGTPGAEVKPLSEAILKHGMEDGAIRMMSTDQTVWINPYFTNLALYALLRASESAPELMLLSSPMSFSAWSALSRVASSSAARRFSF